MFPILSNTVKLMFVCPERRSVTVCDSSGARHHSVGAFFLEGWLITSVCSGRDLTVQINNLLLFRLCQFFSPYFCSSTWTCYDWGAHGASLALYRIIGKKYFPLFFNVQNFELCMFFWEVVNYFINLCTFEKKKDCFSRFRMLQIFRVWEKTF